MSNERREKGRAAGRDPKRETDTERCWGRVIQEAPENTFV
eukprot:CAMPEP_0194432042 /NCGR_PEP_ID=MMETSP0176-20130528/67877_1 /TAXON_ID=216777 /ORGANISM="Proboscia alata, Strain PI-D3" /LENGTH=39 /DNA_ID= /DNA_START= /DNA_END= /DNA_ORIENTATION=